jgi:hypothetical protein
MKVNRKRLKNLEIEIFIPEKLWNTLKYLSIIFFLLVFIWILSYQPFTTTKNETSNHDNIYETTIVELTPEQLCQMEGNVWCNGKCYLPCPSGQRFNCPPNGEPTCIITRSIEDIKKSIVYIRHDVIGCCDSYGYYSSYLGGSGTGIIYSKYGSTVYVLTSRHVIDCVFAGNCLYPKTENITIRTQDGSIYTPTKILYAPGNLDLAILQFESNNDNIVPVLISDGNISIGEKIIAIGYPVIALESPEPILQFSVTKGKITNVYDLLTYRGVAFNGIESDALTDKGASGGGLFNEDGHLIGVIAWGNREQRVTIAIDIKVLDAIKEFKSCPAGYYPLIEGDCCPYGTIYGQDGKCHEPCGKPNKYCSSPDICCNGICHSPCPPGYILGDDCMCHQECGKNRYCPDFYTCCNEQCVYCPIGSFIGSDCKCHSYWELI